MWLLKHVVIQRLRFGAEDTAFCWRRNSNIWPGLDLQARWVLAVSYVVAKRNKYARKSLRTRSEATAIEKGKAASLEIYVNLQQGQTYFSITTKEGVEKHLSFRMRDEELGYIVKGRHTTIATHLQHFLSYIGKDTKLKELERTDCENYSTIATKLLTATSKKSQV